MTEPLVTVKPGKLVGKTLENINGETFFSFQGIPYAEPPIGTLRFKSPRPVKSWVGVLDASQEGNECIQRGFFKELVGDEDCLHLNVYTPELPKSHKGAFNLKPVMFWVHGGGFTSGSSRSAVYGPEFLLTEDIVLVTVNYRIGILGFLSLEDLSLQVPGNAGLKDIVLALKWVRENIENFGGDPKNVTIFGESAGGAAVHYLVLSLKAKGLFHKAIMQSGCALNLWARAYRSSQDLANILNLNTTNEKDLLKHLQTLHVHDLYKAAENIPDHFIASRMRPHGPVIEKKHDDAFLWRDPVEIIKSGEYNHVPMIFGYNTREGMIQESLQKNKPIKPVTDMNLVVPYVLGLERGSNIEKLTAKRIKEFYYGDDEPSEECIDKFYLIETDNFFLRDIIRSIKFHLESTNQPIYLYRMSIETSLNLLKNISGITSKGVAHADDLGYLFKSLLTPDIAPESHEHIAIKRFVKLWTNFARNSNPNSKLRDSLIPVTWETVREAAYNFLDIDKDLTVGVNPEENRIAFWEDIFKLKPVSKL